MDIGILEHNTKFIGKLQYRMMAAAAVLMTAIAGNDVVKCSR